MLSLVRTKLFAPLPRSDALERPALLARLDDGLRRRRRLSVLIAPAGFGKTTLAVQWLAARAAERQKPQTPAWLSLDESDSDPAIFARYLVAALRGGWPELIDPLAALCESDRPVDLADICVALINAFASLPREEPPAILVLDDYHAIASVAVHRALAFFIDHLPPQLHLLLLSREDPPLPLARLRVHGELTELRAADLSFTFDEADAVLRSSTGLSLSPSQASALYHHTEGWPAGLQFAALSLKGHADPARALAAFATDERFALDYLLEEVVNRQPEPVRGFWRATAVLDRLCADLCDHVIAAAREMPGMMSMQASSLTILDHLERQNLFLTPLDERREWYRYHQLFASLLRARLAHEPPELRTTLHRAASAWFGSHALWGEAIHHALASGDEALAADLITNAAPAWIARNEVQALATQVERLPRELLLTRPPLMLSYAQSLISTGRIDDASTLLNRIPPEGLSGAQQLALRGAQAVVAGARGDTATVAGIKEAVAPQLPAEATGMRGLIAFSAGLAASLQGDVDEAIHCCEQAVALLAAAGPRTVALVALQTLARARTLAGDLRGAAAACDEALALGALPGGEPLSAAGPALLVRSSLHYEWDELAVAERFGRRAAELCRRWGHAGALGEALASLACTRHAQGDDDEAARLLAEADELVAGMANELPGVTNVRAAQLRLRGPAELSVPSMQHWLRTHLPVAAAEARTLAIARAWLNAGHPATAIELLAGLPGIAMAAGRLGSVIEALTLESLARHALEQTGATLPSHGGAPVSPGAAPQSASQTHSLALLEEALTLAAPRGYMRLFLDLGAPLRQLTNVALHRWRSEHPCRPYLERLLEAYDAGSAMQRDTAAEATVKKQLFEQASATLPAAMHGFERLQEPLSDREREVLALAAAGLSNSEIAERLILAPGTVKRHLHNIYGKLGVDDRLRAVNRAREIGLI